MKSPDSLTAAALEEGPRRVAALAAWVQSLAGDADGKPILVGGGAVELYTGGAYRTGDLDFVGTCGADVARQLEQAGFRRRGRLWIQDEHEIVLEFPSSELGQGETSALIEVGPYTVVVIGLEELIVDRLASWQFWRSEIDGINAYLLVRVAGRDVDRDRLRRLADAASVSAALAGLELFVARLGDREPTPDELEEWSRTPLERKR